MNNALKISGLCKSYEQFSLKNVGFSLPIGYIMGFVGQNGSGKTTTIRAILNMLNRDAGEIKILGMDSVKDEIKIKQHVGVVFDDLFFAGHLNTQKIGSQLKVFYSDWNDDRFKELTDKFNLPLKKPVSDFSKGMKMKFMIACALSHKAELLILDEPTSGLDPVARDELLDILTEYIESGERSILFSTHITADLERIADYITVLHDGKVFFSDTKDCLLEKYLVVKGDVKDINDDIRSELIGFHSYRNGFEAMIESKFERSVPNSLITEKASIDEIMVYIAKEASK